MSYSDNINSIRDSNDLNEDCYIEEIRLVTDLNDSEKEIDIDNSYHKNFSSNKYYLESNGTYSRTQLNYYSIDISKNEDSFECISKHVVCYYSSFKSYYKYRLPIGLELYLTLDEICTLDGNNWLVDKVIDFSALIMHSKSLYKNEITIFSTMQSLEILNTGNIIYKKRLPKVLNNLWIMPVNLNQIHWVCVIVNFNTNEFYLLDPLGPLNTQNKIKIFDNFQKFLKNSKISPKLNLLNNIKNTLTLSRHLNAIQQDFSSCGIFVISFIKAFLEDLNNANLIDRPNVAVMRNDIKIMLLDNSDNILCYCYDCSKPLCDIGYSKKCENCDRQLCSKCASTSPESTHGRCVLCEENVCFGCNAIVVNKSNKKCIVFNRTLCEFCKDSTLDSLGVTCICLMT